MPLQAPPIPAGYCWPSPDVLEDAAGRPLEDIRTREDAAAPYLVADTGQRPKQYRLLLQPGQLHFGQRLRRDDKLVMS